MLDRDHTLEREVVDRAGGLPEYGAQLEARLDHFEVDDGGNVAGWDQSIDALLVEAQEEAVDITGWLIGAAMKLHSSRRHRIFVAMALAAKVHQELAELRCLLADESVDLH